jgi:2'-5' RNA ligase
MRAEPGQRIFFALWPDDAVRRQIVDQFRHTPQSKTSARLMRKHNLHITLHFIGNVDAEQRGCMHQAAQQVRGEPFQLSLDRYGHFYRAKVFWLGSEQAPQALFDLYAALGEAIEPCGYRVERRPYAPHVTLLRKLNRPGEMIKPEPIQWSVNEFVMVESVPIEGGVDYRVIERYALVGNGAG